MITEMPLSCSVIGCNSRAKKGGGISFYFFPADDERKAQWITKIGRAGWDPPKHARICSKHFLDGRPTDENPLPLISAHQNRHGSCSLSRPCPEPSSRPTTNEQAPADDDDDDVIICEENINGAVRKDLEMVLRSTSSVMNTPQMALKDSKSIGITATVTRPMPKREIQPRVVIESVRKISPEEFQNRQNKTKVQQGPVTRSAAGMEREQWDGMQRNGIGGNGTNTVSAGHVAMSQPGPGGTAVNQHKNGGPVSTHPPPIHQRFGPGTPVNGRTVGRCGTQPATPAAAGPIPPVAISGPMVYGGPPAMFPGAVVRHGPPTAVPGNWAHNGGRFVDAGVSVYRGLPSVVPGMAISHGPSAAIPSPMISYGPPTGGLSTLIRGRPSTLPPSSVISHGPSTSSPSTLVRLDPSAMNPVKVNHGPSTPSLIKVADRASSTSIVSTVPNRGPPSTVPNRGGPPRAVPNVAITTHPPGMRLQQQQRPPMLDAFPRFPAPIRPGTVPQKPATVTATATVTVGAAMKRPIVINGAETSTCSGTSPVIESRLRPAHPQLPTVAPQISYQARPSTHSTTAPRLPLVSTSHDSTGNKSSRYRSYETLTKQATVTTKKAASDQPVVDFPFGYYGRFRCGDGRRFSSGEQFDGLFLCSICDEICVSNVTFLNHVYGHFLYPSFDDEGLEHQTKCVECWRVFRDPFELANHHDEVHSTKANSSTVCYICERSFSNVDMLKGHMIRRHAVTDLPYSCKKCQLWSSLYSDIWNHFLMHHDQSLLLMCPLCLTTMNATVSRRSKYGTKMATANTDSFTAHLMRHVEVGREYCCGSCKLQFLSKSDLTTHLKMGHRRQAPEGKKKASGNGSTSAVSGIEWDGSRPISSSESMRDRLQSRSIVQPPQAQLTLEEAICVECQQPTNGKSHYSKWLKKCRKCSYSSYCSASLKTHETSRHGIDAIPFEYVATRPNGELILESTVRCPCGYGTRIGSWLAHHVQTCPASDGVITIPSVRNYPPTQSRPPNFMADQGPQDRLAAVKALKALKLVPVNGDNEKHDGHETSESTSLQTLGHEVQKPMIQEREEHGPSAQERNTSNPRRGSVEESPRRSRPQLLKRSRSQSNTGDDVAGPSQKRPNNGTRPKTTYSKLGHDFCQRYEHWNECIGEVQDGIVSTGSQVSQLVASFNGVDAMRAKYTLVLDQMELIRAQDDKNGCQIE